LDSEASLSLFQAIPDSSLFLQSPWVIQGLCIISILLFLSVIFSGAESAYFSLNPDHKARLEGMQKNRSRKVLKLISDPEQLMATLMTVNLAVNLLIILTSAFLLNHFPLFALSSLQGILLQILAISLLIIIFGKLLPKIYAHNKSLTFALFSVNFLFIAQKLVSPISRTLLRLTSIINRSLLKTTGNLSINELSEALDQDKGVVTEDRKILMGIVNFSTIEVSDVMKPRMDVVAADIEYDFLRLIQIINDSGYSRIPVYAETFDNIKGIVYVKDLLPFLGENENFKWQDLIRAGYYVPETKKLKDLLQEFLDKKIHMAVVVDEYGGTEGIVTLEDVLEEIVGEITDESDEIESFYSKVDENNYIFDGKILLNDFFKIVQLPEELFEPFRGEADTLAGLILEIKGTIPPANEVIPLKDFSFTILSVDDRRIKKVKFTLNTASKKR